jgi:hypothetical protein
MALMKSYSATYYVSSNDVGPDERGKIATVLSFEESTISAQKPGKLLLKVWVVPSLPAGPNGEQPLGAPYNEIASDGTTDFLQNDKKYLKRAADPTHGQLGASPLLGFFPGNPSLQQLIKEDANAVVTFSSPSVVEGIPCDTLDIRQNGQSAGRTLGNITFYIGHADHLIHRVILRTVSGSNTQTVDTVVKVVATDPVLNQSIFTYTPPPGVEETKAE